LENSSKLTWREIKVSEKHEIFSAVESQLIINPTPEVAGLRPFDSVGGCEFQNWEPDHLHWNVPSSIYLYSNGEMVFFAKRLSNQRRTGVLDGGRTFYATLEFQFYKVSGDSRPFYTYELPVVKLGWKTRVDDYTRVWELPGLIPYVTQSYATVTRHWRTDSNEAPPVVIPFPTIEF
jgi:hypothetical protein